MRIRISRRTFLAALPAAGWALVRGAGVPVSARAAPAPRVQTAPRGPTIPRGWIVHTNPLLGFAAAHPRGWTVRPLEPGLFQVNDRSNGWAGARVYAQIFALKRPARAAEILDLVAALFGTAYADFRPVWVRSTGTRPEAGLLRASFTYTDGPRKAAIACLVVDDAAAVYGFDAPAGVYGARRNILANVVRTFRFVPPALRVRLAQEPIERAFRVPLPEEWRATLSVSRPYLAPVIAVAATHPSGNAGLEVSLPRRPLFTLPHPSLEQMGLHEGEWHTRGAGVGVEPSLIARYHPDTRYVKDLLLRGRTDIALIRRGDRPDLTLGPEQEAVRTLMQGRVDAGEIEYRWKFGDAPAHLGKAIVMTQMVPDPATRKGGAWEAYLRSCFAPEADFPATDAALFVAGNFLELDPGWYAGEFRAFAERMELIRPISAELHAFYAETMRRRGEATLRFVQRWGSLVQGAAGMAGGAGRDYGAVGEGRLVDAVPGLAPLIQEAW
ncbi:MAG: hypothetical protein HY660_17945 [Armatimonadetes bacterium]|nr:hypothetical protein [Armatimonadota bacterium]